MIAARSASIFVLQKEASTPAEINAAKLVELMGGTVAFVQLPEGGEAERIQETVPQGAAIIARAGVLAAAFTAESGSAADWLATLMRVTGHCFVFGFEPGRACDRLLQELTGGQFRTIESLARGTERLEVSSEQGDICCQLSGLAFDAQVRSSESVFRKTENATDGGAVIRLAGKPQLLWTRYRNTALMLLASGEIADPDESSEGRAPMAGFFSRLAPLLMFLRRTGGDEYWHGESPRACLILDDPLLKPRYGFLEFEKLLALMQTENFSTSIAFIPWNHRRSDRRVAELFRQFPTRLSMSIHGCDHTGAEFASTDKGFLREQAARSLLWMTKHRELTGVGFDDVMVFPQGHFSTAAMDVLQSCGYLAAINSTGRPLDGGEGCLQLRDLLDVAITRFSGFPLFVRHYPADVVGLALDLFLGKPALLVEHHGYFKDGYQTLAEKVRMLMSMEPRLEWSNLSTICSRAAYTRNARNGDVLVRFYTDRFELYNDTNDTRRYVLQYQQGAGSPVLVDLNGVPAERTPVADGTVARVDLAAGQVVKVKVRREHEPALSALPRRALVWRAKVSVRRHLSELRDNHVDRHPLLKRMVSRVRSRLAGSK